MKQLGVLVWNEFKTFENTCDRAHSKLSSWTAAYNVTKEETSYHAVLSISPYSLEQLHHGALLVLGNPLQRAYCCPFMCDKLIPEASLYKKGTRFP